MADGAGIGLGIASFFIVFSRIFHFDTQERMGGWMDILLLLDKLGNCEEWEWFHVTYDLLGMALVS